jgi:molybdopterin-guanine dinucleotide biosynthesis protein A
VTSTSPIAGIILAGGLATRMGGGDKPLIEVAGRPMLDHVVERLTPQVALLAINANGDPARFAAYRLPVVADPVAGNVGPLAGILAGMRWTAREVPDARFLASVAGDTPFFPRDLVARLGEGCGRDEGTIALAASAAGVHPVFGLWPVALADDLEAFLEAGESRKILAFADRYLRLNVPFDSLMVDGEEIDPFFNVNTPEDAKAADAIARGLARSGNG